MNSNSLYKTSDYTSAFNPVVYSQIQANSKCLDIGCWTGNLGKRLIQEKQCRVDGVEVDKNALQEASKKGYKKTFHYNLNDSNLSLKGIRDKYDVIICADVLEHLVDPSLVLIQLKKNLKSDGFILISLPNVAFVHNRIELMLGRWEYKDFGTLDKTHLRFYTIKSLQSMVKATGLEIIEVKPYNQFGLLRYIWPLDKLFPELFAYQIMLKARNNGS